MKKSDIYFLLTICLILLSFALRAQKTVLSDNPLKSGLDSAVHQAAKAYLQDSAAIGIVITVVRNGESHYYRYGENIKGSGKLTPPGLYYNMGSVAKTFVATILAQAVIEKRASLSDDIRKYLPQGYANLQYNGVPIKLVDLANHTSALPATFHQYPPSAMEKIKGKTLTEQADFFSTYSQDTLLLDLHHLKPDTIPGTKFRYNSSAYMLLTLLLERIYHKPFQQIVTGYLRKKLDISHATPLLGENELRMAAQGYDRNGKPVKYINLKGYFIGPTMNSKLEDLARFIEAQLADEDPAIQLTHQRTFGTTGKFGLGLGWMMNTESGHDYLYHDGNTKIGFNTLCTIYPKQRLGIVIIVNEVSNQSSVGELENRLHQLIE